MSIEGGAKLRKLRKDRHETIENLATDAGITYKTLSEIERGVTKQPAKEILGKILKALAELAPLRLDEQESIYKAYGYKAPILLPTTEEIKAAVKVWHKSYNVPKPAYLVDISQRLLAWNKYAIHLLGLRPNDPRLRNFKNITIFDFAFNSITAPLIEVVNINEYVPTLIKVMKMESEPYKGEPWYDKWINDTKQKYLGFRDLWDAAENNPLDLGFADVIILRIPNENGLFKFQLSRSPFATDSRFYTVTWDPVDQKTILKCAAWVDDDNE